VLDAHGHRAAAIDREQAKPGSNASFLRPQALKAHFPDLPTANEGVPLSRADRAPALVPAIPREQRAANGRS
jgi:hypothetical protein